jgi:hypothetical protein
MRLIVVHISSLPSLPPSLPPSHLKVLVDDLATVELVGDLHHALFLRLQRYRK